MILWFYTYFYFMQSKLVAATVKIENWSSEESHSSLPKYFPTYVIHFGCQQALLLPKYLLCWNDGLFLTLPHLSQRKISLNSPFQWRISSSQAEQEISSVSSELGTLFPVEILKSLQRGRGLEWLCAFCVFLK